MLIMSGGWISTMWTVTRGDKNMLTTQQLREWEIRIKDTQKKAHKMIHGDDTTQRQHKYYLHLYSEASSQLSLVGRLIMQSEEQEKENVNKN